MEYALDILHKAGNLITGDRKRKHGDFIENHANIAKLWSGYLGSDVSALDVLTMMALLKVARTKAGDYDPDNYLDLIGYSALAGQLASIEDEKRKKRTLKYD
jgi:hypothetical protein|tara:strand:+ start:1844 stop:2149 length:306 start_codon:yes stop_codon:yes gene_type:complete